MLESVLKKLLLSPKKKELHQLFRITDQTFMIILIWLKMKQFCVRKFTSRGMKNLETRSAGKKIETVKTSWRKICILRMKTAHNACRSTCLHRRHIPCPVIVCRYPRSHLEPYRPMLHHSPNCWLPKATEIPLSKFFILFVLWNSSEEYRLYHWLKGLASEHCPWLPNNYSHFLQQAKMLSSG